MNKENLLRAADYVETIPQKKFDMFEYRDGCSLETRECGSVGCIIGHCTVLDERSLSPFRASYGILFKDWSRDFFGITDDDDWEWLFGPGWQNIDNTPDGAAARIRHFVEHGRPRDWELVMEGKHDIKY